jgi:hypothetical protein
MVRNIEAMCGKCNSSPIRALPADTKQRTDTDH